MPDWSKVVSSIPQPSQLGRLPLHPRGNFEAFTQAASKHKWLEGIPVGTRSGSIFPLGWRSKNASSITTLRASITAGIKEPRVWLNLRRPFSKEFQLRKESEWPLAGTRWTKLFLDAKAGSLDWRAPTADGTTSFAASGDGVKWMTPPLEHETEITGPMALKLYASSSTTDADLFVTAQAFSPDGREYIFKGRSIHTHH